MNLLMIPRRRGVPAAKAANVHTRVPSTVSITEVNDDFLLLFVLPMHHPLDNGPWCYSLYYPLPT